MININNPFILLRVLVICDILLSILSIFIPGFKDESFIDYVSAVFSNQIADGVYGYLWLICLAITFLSWFLLLAKIQFGRYVYLVPLPITVFLSFKYGNGSYGPGIWDAFGTIYIIYYGFMICMLFFGPVSIIFTKEIAQQGDAPEPASPAR